MVSSFVVRFFRVTTYKNGSMLCRIKLSKAQWCVEADLICHAVFCARISGLTRTSAIVTGLISIATGTLFPVQNRNFSPKKKSVLILCSKDSKQGTH